MPTSGSVTPRSGPRSRATCKTGGAPGQPGRTGSNVPVDPARLRLDRRQLQGNSAPLHPDRDARRAARRRLPGPRLPGPWPASAPGPGCPSRSCSAENATGNYVKVTQRPPVRIELTEPNPEDRRCSSGCRSCRTCGTRSRRPAPSGPRLHRPGTGGPPIPVQARRLAVRATGPVADRHEAALPHPPGETGRGRPGSAGSGRRSTTGSCALTVTMATFMEVLDTSIANVMPCLHRRRPGRRPEPDHLGRSPATSSPTRSCCPSRAG